MPKTAPSKKSRRGKNPSGGLPGWVGTAVWTLGMAAAVYSLIALWAPNSIGGWLGASLGRSAHALFGSTAYLLPLIAGYGLIIHRYSPLGARRGLLSLIFGSLLSIAALAGIFFFLGTWLERPEWGGALGFAVGGSLRPVFGWVGALLLEVALGMVGLQILFGVPWDQVAVRAWKAVVEDYQSWVRARREMRGRLALAEDKLAEKAAERRREADKVAEQARARRELSADDKPKIAARTPHSVERPAPKAEGDDGAESGKPKILEAPKVETAGRAAPKKPGKGQTPYDAPSIQLLKGGDASGGRPSDAELEEAAERLNQTLANFKIDAKVTDVLPGPVITRYEVAPAPGVKVNTIVAREADIALAMKAKGLRILAPIPGKAAIGFELPNPNPATVTLRDILESAEFNKSDSLLEIAMGKTAEGLPLTGDIAKMPHLLVAGATGSGKSVFMHGLIQSILFRARPDEVKFLMIDPKQIELTFYDGIPHLYDPKTTAEEARVVTDPKEADRSLKAMVTVMEHRYALFREYGVRNIESFNEEAKRRGDESAYYIVVVIDELADLMMTNKASVEGSVQRLAQKARAVGIHLVLATQRPSVNVITGVIKANLPTRVALQVLSQIDSRVILDENGAEALIGRGDMLYLATGAQRPQRVQAPFVSDREINAVVEHLRAQGTPRYEPLESAAEAGAPEGTAPKHDEEELRAALRLVLERRRVSQDLLKANFGGSAKASNLLSLLELKGFIHKPEGRNRWEIQYDKIEAYLAT